MELVRFVFRAALLATAFGLAFELFIPGGERIVDGGAAVFAVATWIVPLGILARWHLRPPRTSLGSAGIAISIFTVAISLSLMTILLAGFTLLFARGGDWAWPALGGVVAFWVVGAACLSFVRRPSRSTPPQN